RRAGSTPRARAAATRFSRAAASPCSSHSTLPSTARSSRIQQSNTGGTILKLLLKQQNTNPVSGRPARAADGVSAAISRRRAFAREVDGRWAERLANNALFVEWRDEPVAEHVVDEPRPHGARIAEPGDLHRRRALRQDAGTVVRDVAVEVDADVDAEFRQLGG